jgi:subtilisin family serine protease
VKKILIAAMAAFVANAALVPVIASAGESTLKVAPAGRRISGEVIVRYRSGVDPSERSSSRAAVGSLATRSIVRSAELVDLDAGTTVSEAIATLEADPDVLYAEPNYAIEVSAVPNDPSYRSLWAMQQSSDVDIDANEAWNTTTGSESVIVGVMDTGIDRYHADLAGNIWVNPGESGDGRETNGLDDDNNGKVDDVHGWDFAEGDADAMDDYGHGTHVAGTIGAQGDNGIGVTGVNWDVSLMPLRVLGTDGVGSTWDAAQAFTYAARNGATVVNASFGGEGYSRSLNDAIAASPGTLLVTSAGNDAANNDTTPQYPCNMTPANIVCVAATNWSDELSGYSNYGATTVDIGAPGSYILSTTPGGNYAYYSGTSMASPQVAGAAALLKSYAPNASAAELKTALMSGAVATSALAGKTVAGGRLNLVSSLALIAPVPAPSEPAPLPGDPTPGEPVPTQPAPSQPAPLDPAPSTPVTDPTPAPSAPAEPNPTPAPGQPAPEPVVHIRSVSLRLGYGLLARGRVTAHDGFEACHANTIVKIRRNGKTISRVVTDRYGRFRTWLPNRSGRYTVTASQSIFGTDICTQATAVRRLTLRRR